MIGSVVLRVLWWVVIVASAVTRRIAGMEGVALLLRVLPPSLLPRLLARYRAQVGERVRIYPPLLIHNAGEDFSALRIGDRCHIGRDVFLDLRAPIELGDRVTISMRSTILTHIDVGDSEVATRYPKSAAPVRIEDDVYLGAGCIVLHGVTIGKAAVVGAGSVVRSDVSAGARVAGVPARPLA